MASDRTLRLRIYSHLEDLYDRSSLDFESGLDWSQPYEYWRRYLYLNAGYFYYKYPKIFGDRFLNYSPTIRDDGPREIICQPLNPWLDQVTVPLVIHSFGSSRDVLEAGYINGAFLALSPFAFTLCAR